MSTDIQLSAISSLRDSEDLRSGDAVSAGATSQDPEDKSLLVQSVVVEVSGAAGHGALESEAHLSLRPPFVRLDSAQTVVERGDIGKGLINDVSSAPEDISPQQNQRDSMAYPPSVPVVPPSGSIPETTRLRRLRMLSSFVTLFLAGWKSVDCLLYRS